MSRHHSHNMSKRNRATRKAALLRRDGNTCRLCGESFTESRPPCFAHLVAREYEAGDGLANLFLAHNECNNRRTAEKLGRRRTKDDAAPNGWSEALSVSETKSGAQ
jgi:5-methylcytosine-specific restriction endonuclease McrA